MFGCCKLKKQEFVKRCYLLPIWLMDPDVLFSGMSGFEFNSGVGTICLNAE